MTDKITTAAMSQFYGSDQIFFHPFFRGINYTQGCSFLMHNGAAWLVEDVLSHALHNPKVRREEFVVAKLKVKDRKAMLTFDDGNGKVVARQKYDYTNFPLPEISFYIENGMLMLPTER